MEIAGKVAVITGAASGIGRAVASELARRNVRAMALVDMGENIDGVAADVNAEAGRKVAFPYRGDTTDEAFRASVFDSISSEFELDIRQHGKGARVELKRGDGTDGLAIASRGGEIQLYSVVFNPADYPGK